MKWKSHFIPFASLSQKEELRRCVRVQLRLGLYLSASPFSGQFHWSSCASDPQDNEYPPQGQIQQLIIFLVFFTHCWIFKTAFIHDSIPFVHP